MITRNLYQPTHGPGMPTNVASAHGMMLYAPLAHSAPEAVTGMALAPESIMYDPSNPASDPYEQHYPSGVASSTPVATRLPYFLAANPQPGAPLEGPVSTRPVR